MLTDAELEAMRGDVLGVMGDRVVVTRAGEPTVDPVTHDTVPGTPTVIYEGPAHVRVPDSYELDVLFADVERTKQRIICTFPMGTETAPQHDDVLTLTEGAPLLVDQSYRIVAVTGGTYNLGYRVALEQVT